MIALDGERYLNLYLPIFGPVDDVAVHAHPRGLAVAGCLDGQDGFEKLAAFSHGFYRVDLKDGELVMSDLRMGLTPSYVFRFAIAERNGDGLQPDSPGTPKEHARGAGRSRLAASPIWRGTSPFARPRPAPRSGSPPCRRCRAPPSTGPPADQVAGNRCRRWPLRRRPERDLSPEGRAHLPAAPGAAAMPVQPSTIAAAPSLSLRVCPTSTRRAKVASASCPSAVTPRPRARSPARDPSSPRSSMVAPVARHGLL